MRKLRKLLKAVVLVVVILVVLAVAGVIAVAVLADKVVQSAVEKAGTKTLNVAVKVGKADVAILRGSVGLQSIAVSNPAGFQGPALLTLERVNVAADTRSVLSNEVHITDMRLADMEVFVEQKGLQNNLYEVIKPLREPRKPTGKSLLIDNLEIANVTVHASLSGIPGKPQTAQFTLGNITMTDLGRDEKIDTAVLISKILLAVAAGVAQQGGDILPKETVGEITGVLDKAINIGRTIFGPGKAGDPNQQKGAQDLGKTVTEGIKGILGGKKKE
jgi:hypothetical protein